MPKLIEKATGKSWDIPSDDLQSALDSGLYDAPAGTKATVVNPQTGLASDIPAEDLATVEQLAGRRAESAEEFRGRENVARIEREHGGIIGGAGAFAEGIAQGASLGLYGLAARVVSPEYAEDLRERAQAHDIVAPVGSVVGAVGAAALTGGESLVGRVASASPVGWATRAGAGVAERFGGKAVGRTLGMGVEGAIMGAGTGLEELGYSDDPITLERLASVVPSRALLGGATGLGLGAALTGVEKGLSKGKRLIDKAGASLRARSSIADDLVGLDKPALKVAEDAERVVLAEARTAEQKAIAAEVGSGDVAFREADPWRVATGAESRKITQTSSSLRRAADEPIGLAERPGKVLDPLRRRVKTLDDMLAKADDTAATLAAEDAQLTAKVQRLIEKTGEGEAVLLKGKAARRWADLSGQKVSKSVEVSLEDAVKLGDALANGELAGARKTSLDKLQGLRDADQKLVDRIVALEKAPASERLAQIGAAREALDAPPSFAAKMLDKAGTGYMMSAATGLVGGGPIGMAVGLLAPEVIDKVKSFVVNRLVRAGAKEADRTTGALGAFLGLAEPAKRAAVPLATKTLESVAYGPPPAEPDQPAPTPRKERPLIAAYRKRADELRSQTAPGPDGKPQMTMPARQAVADRLAPVRAVAPVAADRIETVVARKVSFLASKLPRKPAYEAMQIGPDGWRPSDMLVRQFARYVAAAEDPGGVEERLFHGAITKEDGEAYRAVYPERFADLVRQLAERLPELTKQLPYKRRLALSIFTGLAMDPAFDPQILRVLQGAHEAEEGTAGGTQPAMAQANFGSVSKEAIPQPTASQRRSA